MILRDTRIRKGQHLSPLTEFKQGEHWRPSQPWWDREWLRHEYVDMKRSATDIAKGGGCKRNNILYWLKKHGIIARSTHETRALKHWGAVGARNPMFGRRGDRHPGWRGGTTPFRQWLYKTDEWLLVAKAVRARDKVCRKCGAGRPHEIHHIEPLALAPLLATELWNLILLCVECHKKIRGKELWWRRRLYALIGVKAGRAA